jgi:hypothetical protein
MGCFASLSILTKTLGATVIFAPCITLKRADPASVGKDNLTIEDPLATMNFDCRDGSGVSKGTIRHEFGHVLGFLHEYV